MNTLENLEIPNFEHKKSAIYDGLLDTKDLDLGEVVYMVTGHTTYKIEKREDGMYVSGNEKYCPQPIKVDILSANPKGIPDMGILWTGHNVRFNGIDNNITFETKSGIKTIFRNLKPEEANPET